MLEKINYNKGETKTYIDLFSGCGGLSLGLHNAGWKGIFAIEKSEDAFNTLEHNLIKKKKHFEWPNWLDQKHHDINQVLEDHSENLIALRGTIDLVAGGPPCQGFSMAGRRIENDSRNDLINSYIKFIDLVKPKLIFFENVKGFTQGFKKNDKKGRAYSLYVIDELKKKGYTVQGHLINFADYGVPQKRTRFILVGIQNSFVENTPNLSEETFFEEIKNNKENFLISKNLTVNPSLENAISDLLQSNGQVESETPNFKAGIYGEIKSKYQKYLRKYKKQESKVDSHRFAKHTDVVRNRFQIALDENLTSATYRERFNLKKSSTKILEANKPTPTITTLPDDYIHYCEPRIMTVREYARIQSFPDTYQFKGKYTTGGKRRTQEVPRYSQIGNAIPPLFGEQAGLVLKQLIP
ncbi:DNA cytosine methyltransferase [Tenacibaculum maritimum]|uniref:DNA cytosine methyltransferase n=1 Tax=Tenacibaculum maritimum TaxID=107401 RepID=UPI001E38FD3B|nr:DNA cytosine methyltransferase [Tenacibaculum maritimum]MCD9563566.1 DNA cytosine methyltransferase [Tenacibaculum maritimum]MCD9566731.1 DNA cytosine methyltransferase [Tenacibaculum maritimum]MCD9579988.1 DNA cytosine methyltransferase [Tenacibaculum maritimum]MCD9597545.1 DNA cytosine methyltransferase [Tenacibaculum maritimum]MCD9614633.1 DNA cytosine methyltransferase [Tenacibaculum maritimum]